ncbi:MAG: hypothetical protein E7015_02080 [Alphaproteobacteria bacterium]|nr:hypothetical protein [Alphaproteobacteria bacterium]
MNNTLKEKMLAKFIKYGIAFFLVGIIYSPVTHGKGQITTDGVSSLSSSLQSMPKHDARSVNNNNTQQLELLDELRNGQNIKKQIMDRQTKKLINTSEKLNIALTPTPLEKELLKNTEY